MKVSKSLLSAMLIGLTVSATSCTKEPVLEIEEANPKIVKEQEEREQTCGNGEDDRQLEPWNCPACGMG